MLAYLTVLFGKLFIAFIGALLRLFANKKILDSSAVQLLAQNYHLIRSDFEKILRSRLQKFEEIAPSQGEIIDEGIWRMYVLWAYRRRVEHHCAQCAQTARLLANVGGVVLAAFSILEPGTVLAPHRGTYFGVIRCQIPVMIPSGDCAIRIAGTTHYWHLGQPLVFDDTLMHEAWNRTSLPRVVLMLDLERPFPFPLNILNRLMIRLIGSSPFIRRIIAESL